MEQKSRTTASESCPGEAALPGPEFRGTLCPHLPGAQDRESASTCAGAKRRRPASSLEKNPPTSLPSPLPLRKRVKKKKKIPLTPTPGGAAASASQACAPGPRRGLHGSATRPQTPVRAPVPGAAESQTSVTWIFTRQGAATPSFPARTVRNPKRTHRAQRASRWARHALFSLPFPGSLF